MIDNNLDRYLDDIGQTTLLSDNEERLLSERIKQGDQKALGRLVEANLRFVVKLASQYRGRGLQMDDLVSEGNIGLMTAAARYDGSRGLRFVKFAAPYVRRQIERAIDQQNGTLKAVGETVRSQTRTLSVDAPLGYRSNVSLLSVLVNSDAPLADERVYSEAIEHAVEFALLTLSERESQVVTRFYGLDCEYETMAEIGDELGLKRERVRQIRNRAIRRLKKSYRQKLVELRR